MKKGSRKKRHNRIDEHNMPTEPLPDISVYPYVQKPSSDVDRYPYYPSLSNTPLGTNYGEWPNAAGWGPGNTRNQPTRRRRFFPACVGLFFLCVQLLLVVRFGVRFLSLSPAIAWVGVVTDVSEIFVVPFRELWSQMPLVGNLVPATIELYTLIAILLYGVLSRLLVGILKVMLKSR
jgi:hypothetical protein